MLPANVTGKHRSIVWHHNFLDLMLGASFSLKLLEMVLTEQRNPKEVMVSGSSKNASNLGSFDRIHENGI